MIFYSISGFLHMSKMHFDWFASTSSSYAPSAVWIRIDSLFLLQEWERPKPGRRPDIFPQFSPMKTPLPTPLPADPPEEDEEEEEEKKEEEEEDPEKEEPEKPDKQ